MENKISQPLKDAIHNSILQMEMSPIQNNILDIDNMDGIPRTPGRDSLRRRVLTRNAPYQPFQPTQPTQTVMPRAEPSYVPFGEPTQPTQPTPTNVRPASIAEGLPRPRRGPQRLQRPRRGRGRPRAPPATVGRALTDNQLLQFYQIPMDRRGITRLNQGVVIDGRTYRTRNAIINQLRRFGRQGFNTPEQAAAAATNIQRLRRGGMARRLIAGMFLNPTNTSSDERAASRFNLVQDNYEFETRTTPTPIQLIRNTISRLLRTSTRPTRYNRARVIVTVNMLENIEGSMGFMIGTALGRPMTNWRIFHTGTTMSTAFQNRATYNFADDIIARLETIVSYALELVSITIQYQEIPQGGALPMSPFVKSNPSGMYVITNDDNNCAQRCIAINRMNKDQFKNYQSGKVKIDKHLKKVCAVLGEGQLNIYSFDKWDYRIIVIGEGDKVIYDNKKPPDESAHSPVLYLYYDWMHQHFHYIRNIDAFCNHDNNYRHYKWCIHCEARKKRETFDTHCCKANKCGLCYQQFDTVEELANHRERPEDLKFIPWDCCPTCNMKLPNENCYNAHVERCKSNKWKCQGCKKWIPISDKESHCCSNVTCKICKKEHHKDEEHRCYISKLSEDVVDKKTVNKVYVYDFESRFVEENITLRGQDTLADKHVVNLCVIKDLDDCDDPDKFVSITYNIEDCIEWMLNQSNCTFIAHNAKSYDLWLIHNCMIVRLNRYPKNIIMAGQKIMYMQVKNICFIDSLNHFNEPLSKLPKTFGFTNSKFAGAKGIYPYKFNTLENEDYVGPIPDASYFEPEYMSQGAYEEFTKWYNDFKESGQVWNNKEKLIDYCKQDVNVLAKALSIYRDSGIKFNKGLDPLAYITIASYTLASYKLNNMPEDSICLHTPEEYNFIRRGFFGGRTEAIKLHKEWSIKDINDGRWGSYVDIQSLYPTCQFYDYLPAGKCAWINNPDECEKLLDECWAHDGGIGYYEVDVVCPKDLYLPLLPEHKKCETGSKLVFDLEDKYNYVCSSIELKKALSLGYKITKYHKALVYERARNDLFKDFIVKRLKVKVECSGRPSGDLEEFVDEHLKRFGIELNIDNLERNEGMRALMKLMLNSLWGKLGMNPVKDKHQYVEQTKQHYSLLRRQMKGEIIDYEVSIINGNCLLTKYKEDLDKGNTSLSDTNIGLAGFVTGSARLRLYKELEKLGERVLYYDTDSIIYEHNDKLYNIPEGKYLGEWEDELGGRKITSFVSIGPKSYAYHCDGHLPTTEPKADTKQKGITLNRFNKQEVDYENMKRLVFKESTEMSASNLVFKKTPKGIYSYRDVKTQGFKFDKRVVQKDNVTTLPHGWGK